MAIISLKKKSSLFINRQSDSHSGIDGDLSFLGYDAVSIGEFVKMEAVKSYNRSVIIY